VKENFAGKTRFRAIGFQGEVERRREARRVTDPWEPAKEKQAREAGARRRQIVKPDSEAGSIAHFVGS